MDYTTILSRLEALFSGNTGVYIIAGIGVFGIIGAHIVRMKFSNSRKSTDSDSYRHMVIAPYVDNEGADPMDAMMPQLSTEAK
jgi:hypothetical protein